jgi:hypothetical protein
MLDVSPFLSSLKSLKWCIPHTYIISRYHSTLPAADHGQADHRANPGAGVVFFINSYTIPFAFSITPPFPLTSLPIIEAALELASFFFSNLLRLNKINRSVWGYMGNPLLTPN